MQEVELMMETSNWRSRGVKYIAGNWRQIKEYIPSFELCDFDEGDGEMVNPYYRTVVRLPLTPVERRIPVGLVSNIYTLAQHSDVANRCIQGVSRNFGIDVESLRCELGLSALSEWMNFRIYFPKDYDYIIPNGNPLTLRLECFNSVEGSSRLIIWFGWYRLICSNGMVITETIAKLRDLHNKQLDLTRIDLLIRNADRAINNNRNLMKRWEKTRIESGHLTGWIDTTLAEKWGKLAAFRVLHICTDGHDAKYSKPFETKKPSQKEMIRLDPVPGSPSVARNVYDVAQVLSWIATNRKNAEERTHWQTDIPGLLKSLTSSISQYTTRTQSEAH